MVTFVGLDGYTARIARAIKPADTYILMRDGDAETLSSSLASGQFTYLVLDDGVAYEIIRVDGGFTAISQGGMSDVPVTRAAVGTPVKFNFGCGRTYATYRITTPVVQQLLAQYMEGRTNG